VTRDTDPAAAVADFFKRAVIYADSTDLYIFNPLRFNVHIGVGVDGFSDEAALPEAVRSRAEQNLVPGSPTIQGSRGQLICCRLLALTSFATRIRQH